MALYKLCRCGKRIEYHMKYCTDCMKAVKEEKKDRVKHYNKNIRHNEDNEKYTKVYQTKEWIATRDIARQRDNGLCKVCLKNKNIVGQDVVHHIEEVKENWDKRYDINNCICLCHGCHNEIHAMIKKGIDTTKELKELL